MSSDPTFADAPQSPRTDHGVGTCTVLLRVRGPDDLFQPLDPSPMPRRQVSPQVADYLYGELNRIPQNDRIRLRVHLPGEFAAHEADMRSAIRRHFETSLADARRDLKAHFRRGFRMFVVGFFFAALLVGLTQLLAHLTDNRLVLKVANVFTIMVWVIMWGPLETLVYAWWPIRRRVAQYTHPLDIEFVHEPSPARTE